MKFVTSYSFGKDSALAMYRMIQAGHEPVAILTAYNPEQERSWVHGIAPPLMHAVAESLRLPLILCACAADAYNQGLEEGLAQARSMGAEACAFGDIDIEGHAEYDRARCEAAGLHCALPLWQGGREALLRAVLDAGFQPLIKTVHSAYLDETYLGQTLSLDLAAKIAATGADICGENGEYHTFIYDGPIFSQPIQFRTRGVVDLGTHMTIDLRPAIEA